MLKLEDSIPRKEIADVLEFLFEHPGATIRDYITVRRISPNRTPYTTIASRFHLLVDMKLAKGKIIRKDTHFTAVSREAFEDHYLALILERVFGGDPVRLKVAAARAGKKRHK